MFLSNIVKLNTTYFIPVIILLSIATITPILLALFKLKFFPTFVVEILIGLLIARWFNHYITQNDFGSIMDGIYVLGLSFIMFLSGYDTELDVVKDHERTTHEHINILNICIKITLAVLIISVIVAYLFTRFILDSNSIKVIALLGIVFSSCFAGLVTPLMHDEGLIHSVIGKIFAVFADISEILSILFLSILLIATRITSGYVWLMLVILLVLVIWKTLPTAKIENKFHELMGGIVHLPTRMIILLILGLTALSELSGAEYVLGAYLAGLLAQVTGLKKGAIDFFSKIVYGVFAPMFFIIVGTKIDILHFFSETQNIIYLVSILVALVLVRLPMFYLLKWFKLKTLIPMILLNMSTIIVCIAAEHIGHSLNIFSAAFGHALVLAGIVTSVITPVIFKLNFPQGECEEKCQIKFYRQVEHEGH